MISVSDECHINKSWKIFLRSGKSHGKVMENGSRKKMTFLCQSSYDSYLINILSQLVNDLLGYLLASESKPAAS